MAEPAASAAASGLRAQPAAVRRPTAEVIVQHPRVGNAAPAQRYWRSDRRAFCDRIARDQERTTICR
ncbi:MAG: hypothetical protein QOG79_3007 [Mycobacterium sp.]|jgi:hypothetical protein|nr:hypothetical protein [Mycobacterium sp.]